MPAQGLGSVSPWVLGMRVWGCSKTSLFSLCQGAAAPAASTFCPAFTLPKLPEMFFFFSHKTLLIKSSQRCGCHGEWCCLLGRMKNPCSDLGGAGIFLQQQSHVSYCCLSSQIPALLQRCSPPPPSSAQAGCETTQPVTFHFHEGPAASHLHLPSSLPSTLEKTENMDFFWNFFQTHFALEEPP